MKKKLGSGFFITILSFCFCSIGSVSAANSSEDSLPDLANLKNQLGADVEISTSDTAGTLDFLAKKDGKKSLWKAQGKNGKENSRKFLQKFGKYFGVSSPDRELGLLKKTKDNLNMSHFKYNQKWKGVPVFGGQLTVHLKDDRMVTAINGEIHSPNQLNVKPKISSKKAAVLAKKYWAEKQKGEPESIRDARLYIYNKKFINKRQDDSKDYLVWEVDLFCLKPYYHEIIYVDAATGSLIDRREAIKKIDRRVYNCKAYNDYNTCVLEDTLNNTEHGRSEGAAVRGITDIDNLYDYTGSIYNYYAGSFSRTGANKQGGLGDGTTNPVEKTDSYGRIDYDPYGRRRDL